MKKPQVWRGWAILSEQHGLFRGWQVKRSEMIQEHVSLIGEDWRACRTAGDRAVRVEIRIIPRGAK